MVAFHASYEVVWNPYLPPDGTWRQPVYAFDERGALESPDGLVRPRETIRLEPAGGDPWIGLLPNGAEGFISGCFPTPHPNRLLAISQGLALLIDVTAPQRGAFAWRGSDVVQIFRLAEPPLLLLISFHDILALGADGVFWESGELSGDGLGVLAADASTIRLSAWIHGKDCEIEIGTLTGALVES